MHGAGACIRVTYVPRRPSARTNRRILPPSKPCTSPCPEPERVRTPQAGCIAVLFLKDRWLAAYSVGRGWQLHRLYTGHYAGSGVVQADGHSHLEHLKVCARWVYLSLSNWAISDGGRLAHCA